MKKHAKKKLLSYMGISLALALSLTACGTSGSNGGNGSNESAANDYPSKTITITAPSGAGGGLDTTARALSKMLNETGLVTQPITVENKPGGGQAVGLAEFVGYNQKDPYRLYLPSTPLIINNLKKEGNSPYSFRDLTPIAQLTTEYGAIVVRSDSKYQDLQSLFADMKAHPENFSLAGGSAPGSQDHLVAMLPAVKAGLDPAKIKFVSYDGGGEAMTALLGGSVDVLATDISGTTEYVKAGKVRVLGVSAPERLGGQFADIPTYKEQGIDAEFTIWRGLFGTKEMPDYALAFWQEKLKALSESEEWKRTLEANGWQNGFKTGEEFSKFLEEQEKLIQEILTSLGMAK
ncbi:Bug family tripartite tricarboxylate transporter substrate binding protein [Brevibacillus marinus]|uniref:Bug family tripartite tricarboxylate transporter substrate binding protein n=1 Tax=Brevibacillus marinus TaxID=2496837 RepID=UPI000F83026E|nr:tripartite tricarboxylate transporter substrate binding protein [Brevibacillus marinus]